MCASHNRMFESHRSQFRFSGGVDYRVPSHLECALSAAYLHRKENYIFNLLLIMVRNEMF
jgi:hypothetical protein